MLLGPSEGPFDVLSAGGARVRATHDRVKWREVARGAVWTSKRGKGKRGWRTLTVGRVSDAVG